MSSFRIAIDPRKRVAGRFITAVRAALQEALADEEHGNGINRTRIAERLGIHRSAVTRRLQGTENMTLRTLAEMAWALGRTPTFGLESPDLALSTITLSGQAPPGTPAPSATLGQVSVFPSSRNQTRVVAA